SLSFRWLGLAQYRRCSSICCGCVEVSHSLSVMAFTPCRAGGSPLRAEAINSASHAAGWPASCVFVVVCSGRFIERSPFARRAESPCSDGDGSANISRVAPPARLPGHQAGGFFAFPARRAWGVLLRKRGGGSPSAPPAILSNLVPPRLVRGALHNGREMPSPACEKNLRC